MSDQYSSRFMSVVRARTPQEKAARSRLSMKQVGLVATLSFCAFLAVPIVLGLMAMHKITHGALPEPNPDAYKPTFVFLDESGSEVGVRGPLRRPVDVGKLPRHTIQSFLAIEDRRFFSHAGIDPIGIARAAKHNYDAGRIVEGGSTITQQLIKNVYLTSEQTLDRKLQEAIFALRMENNKSKAEILQEYLYTVYFGSNAYGIEAAAEVYFDKPATKLSIAESAMLAGLIKAPSNYNPFNREELARDRARLVLGSMVKEGFITPIQEQLALYDLEQLSFKAPPPEPNGYFLDVVATRAAELEAPDYFTLRTTLDLPYQQIAENTIKSILTPQIQETYNAHEAAMVVMRPNGEVIAIVGGTDYSASQFNRAASAERQPGSLFKAFVYDAALKKGWRADDYIVDVPITLPVPDKKNEYYKPANYNDHYYGLLTTRTAFAKSANTAALRLQEWVGRDAVIANARKAGLDANPDPWPSLGLGVFETNLLDITAAYASLVAGHRIDPVLLETDQRPSPYLSRGINVELLKLMRESVVSGTSRSTQISVPSFAKTGTTQDYRDAWFMGLTDELIVGVWVGNDDFSPMRKVTGSSIPGLIWKTFMEEALPHLALEKNPPTFADRPLLEIVEEDAEPEDRVFPRPTRRLLGKGRVNADGSLNFYGRNYQIAGIEPGYFQPYTLLAENLPRYANYREMVCEIQDYTAKCQVDGSDLGTLIASKGWARITNNADSDMWYAERMARDNNRGIWGSQPVYASWTVQDSGIQNNDIAVSMPQKYLASDQRVVGEAGPSEPVIESEAIKDIPVRSGGAISTTLN